MYIRSVGGMLVQNFRIRLVKNQSARYQGWENDITTLGDRVRNERDELEDVVKVVARGQGAHIWRRVVIVADHSRAALRVAKITATTTQKTVTLEKRRKV